MKKFFLLSGFLISVFCIHPENLLAQKKCDAPKNFSAPHVGSSSAKIKWNKVDGAIGYKIRGRITGTSQWVSMKVMAPDTLAKITNLKPNSDYELQILTLCNFELTDTSVYCEKIFFHTGFECQIPVQLKTDSVTASSAVLHWLGPLNAREYIIRIKAANDKSSKGATIRISSANATSYKLNNLKSGVRYMWTIKCSCSDKNSDDSEWVVPQQSFSTPEK